MVELIDITTNPVDKIENIACVCYDSQPTEDYKIFKSCMKSGHLSVAEHSQVTFKITCSRACSHQLIRHRTSKPTQRSQRYCSENSFDYYIPDKIKSEIGWEPETMFKDGIKLTIQWFFEHEDWMKNVTSGDYQKYYDDMYANK